MFVVLIALSFAFFKIYGILNPEPSTMLGYSAAIIVGIILAGLWFAVFFLENPDYIEIGETAAETSALFTKIAKKASSTSTSGKTAHNKQQAENLDPDERGEEGEKKVNYELEWWEKSYKLDHPDFMAYTVKADCKSKYSEKCIRLATSPEEEPQEFDHLYLTSFGLIAIETKNYAGNVEVVNDGSWKVNGKIRQSPSNQVRRHNVVLQTILKGKNIPLYSFICLANEETEIIYPENSRTPIVSINSLPGYLDDLASNSRVKLSKNDFWDVVHLLENAKVGKTK